MTTMPRLLIFSLTFIFMLTLGATAADKAVSKTAIVQEAVKPLMVRVAIAREAREIDLAIEGMFTFRDVNSGKVLAKGPRLAKTHVRLLDKGLFIGIDVYPSVRLIIEPARDASIIINNRRFRGEVTFIRTATNRITAVNSINIEDYIKGVLYHEVSHQWPMEALKAQAVATRSYAIYKMGYSKQADFDVTNDIYSQVYGGQESERYRTGLAVDRTEGLVLTYKNRILPAYFFAACGGMTEDANQLWDIDMPPLKGVPCAFCLNSPHMKWKRNYRLKDIQDLLNKNGKKIGAIKTIEVMDRNRSERIDHVKIVARDGKELIVSGKDFREIIGPNALKSNNYEIVMQGYYVDFIGKGWGHGVGMCQWGAKGMADQQFNFKQILVYYYPHGQLLDYHVIHDFKQPAATATVKKSK